MSWTFGSRHLIWHKRTGDVRIDSAPDSTVFLFNVFSRQGRVQSGGREVPLSDTLDMMLDRAEALWINDSYWLVMPFKLKDSGVALHHVGVDTTVGGVQADILELTFEGVGRTPRNKYRIWVDHDDRLVKQWAFYGDRDQAEPNAIWPWDNYQRYGGLLLSSQRSDGRGPRNLALYDQLPEAVFTSFERPEQVPTF